MSAPLPKQADEIITYNPATGEEVGRAVCHSAKDVKTAVEQGRVAFRHWKQTSFDTRKQLILKTREVILAEMDEIAALISAESGKPVAEAFSMEIAPVLDLMQYFAKNTEKLLNPRKIGIGIFGLMGRTSRIVYHPLGVVGIIPAWNYPFTIPLGETVMAVMAGNSVVMKPAEITSMTGMKIGEIFTKAGAPDALVQIVTGDGDTGAALVEAVPDKVMFTGSVATGKKIAAAAAKNLTSVVLELGGKDPMIVLEDADLDMAARGAVWGAFCNAGQSCSSVERLYVHTSIADELTKRIVALTKKLTVDSGDKKTTSVGAMSSERQVKVVEDHVADFIASGALVETGGVRSSNFSWRSGEEPPKGGTPNLFYEPTVITGATNGMRAMQEETFGPTLPIATFTTDEEAIHLANDSEFGLTASVWTKDLARGRRLAERIEAGTVCVNEVLYTHGIGQTPWGGFKNSGRGRTHGREGLLELVQPQHIHVNRLSLTPNAWWFPYTPTAVETFRGLARNFASGSILKTLRSLPQLMRRIKEMRK